MKEASFAVLANGCFLSFFPVPWLV